VGGLDNAQVVATGLGFPEGPVALDDGSVLCVELRHGRLSRVAPDGTVETVADLGGTPNGATAAASASTTSGGWSSPRPLRA
jgi:sugar lactone lactonase YvrE